MIYDDYKLQGKVLGLGKHLFQQRFINGISSPVKRCNEYEMYECYAFIYFEQAGIGFIEIQKKKRAISRES